jgi:hypothetical protein
MSNRTIEVRWTDGDTHKSDYYSGESPYFTIDHEDCALYVYSDQDDWENDVITAYYPKCNVVSARFVED